MVKIKDRYKVMKNRVRRYRLEFIIIGVLCFWYKIIVIVVKIMMLMILSVIEVILVGLDDLR